MLPMTEGQEISNFCRPFLEKMLTDDAQRTLHDNRRQPIAIGHLRDSGDLKKSNKCGDL